MTGSIKSANLQFSIANTTANCRNSNAWKNEAESRFRPAVPSKRIGGEPIEGLQTIKHSMLMLSIENTYSIGELQEFGKRIQKLADGNAKTAADASVNQKRRRAATCRLRFSSGATAYSSALSPLTSSIR